MALIGEKTVDEIVTMSNRKRYRWYKTISPKDKANAMMIVRTTTKEMSAKIESCKNYFYSLTKDGHIIYYWNGFIGVGILETPRDHSTIGVNTIWIYGVGFNEDASGIDESPNVYLTLDEAEDYHKALGICIEKFKEG